MLERAQDGGIEKSPVNHKKMSALLYVHRVVKTNKIYDFAWMNRYS